MQTARGSSSSTGPVLAQRPVLSCAHSRLRSLAHRACAPVLVTVVTFLVFLPSLNNQFVNWDDTVNFVKNPDYRGLAWSNLKWMATTFLMGQWIPFTWFTLAVDYLIWGMDPFGYHLTNVLFHCATALAWYFVAQRLLVSSFQTMARRYITTGATAAALFFSIHPLRAESVAWVTERRDVVSGLFFVLTVLTYLRARASNHLARGWLAGSIVFYTLAALSKSIVATLPLVLLLLDVYPLRRLDLSQWRSRASLNRVIEKWPYLLVATATSVMAVWAQHSNRFLTSLDVLPPGSRVTLVLYSVWFYFSKTIAPITLSPLYELSRTVSLLDPRFALPALGVLALAGIVTLLSRRWLWIAIATMAYVIILAPVSGAFHNGHQLVHDRYSYLSCLPWAIVFGAGVAFVVDPTRNRVVRPPLGTLLAVSATAWLVALGVLAGQQVTVWRDDDTLWRAALEGDPACSICYANLGVALSDKGFPALAISQFERAIAIRPDRVRNYGNLGVALMRTGKADEALAAFERVRARYPDDLNNMNNLAAALMRLGRRHEAMAELRTILTRDPGNLLARINLGLALIEEGRAHEGVAKLEEVQAEKPDEIVVRIGLVRGYLALSRPDEAWHALIRLRQLDPGAATVLEGLFVTVW
jgi:Flp pilus assembly protein TadD